MVKIFLNKEDSEDYEQEIRIKKWLSQKGKHCPEFEFTSINRAGGCRHIGDIGSFSMDEKVPGFESTTYSDIIGGVEPGVEIDGEDIESVNFLIEEFLILLGLKEDVLKWAVMNYKYKIEGHKSNS